MKFNGEPPIKRRKHLWKNSDKANKIVCGPKKKLIDSDSFSAYTIGWMCVCSILCTHPTVWWGGGYTQNRPVYVQFVDISPDVWPRILYSHTTKYGLVCSDGIIGWGPSGIKSVRTLHTRLQRKEKKTTNREMQSCRYKFFCSLQMSRETRDTLIHRNGKVSNKSNKRKKGTNIMQRKKFMIQLPSHERGKKKKKLTVAVVIHYNYVVNILCVLSFFFLSGFLSVTIVRVSWTGQGRGFSLSDSARRGERERGHSLWKRLQWSDTIVQWMYANYTRPYKPKSSQSLTTTDLRYYGPSLNPPQTRFISTEA